METDITKFFPFKTFRDNQKETIEKIVKSFGSDTRIVIVRASVGFGKSPVGITMGKIFDKTYYITPQKILQDQLGKDFKDDDFAIVKGRGNFKCLNNKESCQYGYCIQESIKKPKIDDDKEYSFLESYCIYKPYEFQCPYKVQRDIGAVTKICNMNFAYFLLASREIFTKRDLLIVDEAHSIPDWALNFKTVTISNKELEEMKKIPEYNTFEEYIEWLEEDIMPKIQEKLDAFPSVIHDIDELKLKNNLEKLVDKIQDLRNDYFLNKEEWIWEIEHKNKYDTIKFQPITVGRFMNDLIWKRADKIILMSGTILDPDLFLEEIGLSGEKYEVITVPSNFHHEYNPVLFYPVGKMSKDHKDQTLPKMVEKIREIINKHGEEKGIIHCYDKKTRVLTKDGFKYFKNVSYNDEIATLNKNGILEYHKPINIINYNYSGKMVEIKNRYLNLFVTPEHDMYVKPYGMIWKSNINDGWVFRKANELIFGTKIYGRKKVKKFAVRKTCKWNGNKKNFWEIYGTYNRGTFLTKNEILLSKKITKKIIPIDIWMKFLGWYISEGSTTYREDISQYQVVISQKNIRNTEIPYIIDLMGYNYYIRDDECDQLIISNKNLAKYLLDNFGKSCYDKHLSKEILNLDSENLKLFLSSFTDGDGCKIERKSCEERWQITTSSEILKDQIIEITLKIGYASNVWHTDNHIGLINGRKIISKYGYWIIGIDKSRGLNGIIKSYNIKNKEYNGNVGCVEVPNHIIFVEREGKTAWCGNCHSYDIADRIRQNLFDIRHRLIIQKRESREFDLKRFIESKNGIFISINMNEGLDLKNDLCRYQIILKVPFPFLGDKRVAKRVFEYGDEKWYNLQAVETLCQTLGRAVRSEDDWACLYILDESFLQLWKNYEYYFTNEFKDSYNYGQYITKIKNIQILPL